VQTSVHSITSLINDLLDLGRIEAGFDTQKESVPIGELLKFSVDELAVKIAEKDHSLDLNLAPNLPTVLGNPAHLRQMVMNVLTNSIGYTPPGGMIGVHAWLEGGQVILQISDNGPGIHPSDQPYIFDKFYRGVNVRGEAQGTGLGLAIVKSIVENHQGRIWVDSQIGAGATFTIVLPAESSNM
jgi:two-component system NtrC family sensor kinase